MTFGGFLIVTGLLCVSTPFILGGPPDDDLLPRLLSRLSAPQIFLMQALTASGLGLMAAGALLLLSP